MGISFLFAWCEMRVKISMPRSLLAGNTRKIKQSSIKTWFQDTGVFGDESPSSRLQQLLLVVYFTNILSHSRKQFGLLYKGLEKSSHNSTGSLTEHQEGQVSFLRQVPRIQTLSSCFSLIQVVIILQSIRVQLPPIQQESILRRTERYCKLLCQYLNSAEIHTVRKSEFF